MQSIINKSIHSVTKAHHNEFFIILKRPKVHKILSMKGAQSEGCH